MPYRLVTFDVYSALFDPESTLVPRLAAHLGGPPDRDYRALYRTWRTVQLDLARYSTLLQQGHRAFYALTRQALDYTLARHGLDLPAPARTELVAAWNHLQPWPEAPAVLRALQERGHTLALLSNGDAAMLEQLAAALPVRFAHIFAADQAGAYKPHPAIYRLPLDRLGLAPAEVLHVAGSASDVLGAKAVGLACAWSNRPGEPPLDPASPPDFPMRDLRGLLPVLERA